jgi:prepilin-type N-terminal cleavage/methylation domain-containing protein
MNLTHGSPQTPSVSRHDGDDSGFSLIELLVVILILGILAAVVVLAIGVFRDDAEDSACPADFRNLITASEAYFVQFDTTTIPQANATGDGYEQTLVDVGLARQVSQWYDLEADGELAVPAGSPCTI